MSHFFFEDFFSHPEWGEVRFVAQAIQPGSGGGGIPSGPAGGDLSGTYPNPLFGAGIDRVDGVNEVVTLSIAGSPTGGAFTISFSGFTSAAIPFNATAAQVETALLAVPSVGFAGVDCTGGPLPGTPILIERTGPWAAQTTATAFTTTDSFTGGTAPASSMTITTTAVPSAPDPSATQIGAAGVYLGTGDAIKFGNVAGTSWSPVLSRDSNSVILRGGNSVPILIGDTSGRIGLGMGVVPSVYTPWGGGVVIHNAQADMGGITAVTDVVIVAGARQISQAADLLRFLNVAGVGIGARFNENAYFINGKTAAPADAELDPSEGTWYLASGLPIWKGKDGGGVVVSFNAGDHSARHENGGADEISIAGLDGVSTELATHEADTTAVHGIANTATLYRAGGTDVALADGGTGASLADPGADRIMFWDDSAGVVDWLTAGTNLTITGTTIDATGGGGGAPTTAPYVTTAADAGLSAEVVLGTGVVMSGTLAARPAASIAGRIYLATDVNGGTIYRDTGAAWVQMATGANHPSFNGQVGVVVPTSRGWGVAGASWTANRVVLSRFVLSSDFTVTSLKFRETTGGTGNMDVGIYDATGTRLASAGSTAGKKGANTTQTVTLTAPIALTAGTVYYAAAESDTTDGAYACVNFANVTEQLFGTTLGLSESLLKDTTFPLPASFVTPTSSGAVGAVMALI